VEVVSVGILAYNEQDSIRSTIQSVLTQSIIVACEAHGVRAELIVVPNGCRDNTAEVAAETIEESSGAIGNGATALVSEIPEAGKERAWNHFVHDVSSADAEYLILIDADVRLEHANVLRDLIAALRSNAKAEIAGGVPVKHIELGSRFSLMNRFSVGATSLRLGMKGIFAGCLYCGRARVLRGFRLPTALMGEDAFVRAMVVTSGFTRPNDPRLIDRVPTARVVFEAYTRPSEVLRNKTRRMLELAINSMLYEKFWAEATPERDAGQLTHDWYAANPNWSEDFVRDEFARRGRHPIPSHFVTSQFRQLRLHPWRRRLSLLPVALATLPLNAIAYRRAVRAVRGGGLRKLWDKPAGQGLRLENL
jgi:glycosyltransferase involved in cell wall biosynthesis